MTYFCSTCRLFIQEGQVRDGRHEHVELIGYSIFRRWHTVRPVKKH